MNAWLEQAAQWSWQNSLAAAALVTVLLGMRRVWRGKIAPRWLCLAGWLVMLRLVMPAPFSHPWAWDRAWTAEEIVRVPPVVSVSVPRPVVPVPTVEKNTVPVRPDHRPAVVLRRVEPVRISAPAAAAPPLTTPVAEVIPDPSPDIPAVIPPPAPAPRPVTAAIPIPAAAAPAVAPAAVPVDWLKIAAWTWAAGSIIFFVIVVWRHWRFMRRLRRSAKNAGASISRAVAEDCATLAGLRRAPEMLTVPGGGSPFLFGIRHPCIVLPADSLAALSPAELRHVLLHEMLHVSHRDLSANWLLAGVRALHWWNPLIHLAARRLLADREILRDHQAIALLGDPAERAAYGHTLLKLALPIAAPAPSPGLAPLFRTEKELKRRLTMIQSVPRPHRFAAFAGVVALACVSVPVFTTARGQEDKKKPADTASGDAPAKPGDPALKDPDKQREDALQSLDTRIQLLVEKALCDAGAGRAPNVILDPQTSHIIALIGDPTAAPDNKSDSQNTPAAPANEPGPLLPPPAATPAPPEAPVESGKIRVPVDGNRGYIDYIDSGSSHVPVVEELLNVAAELRTKGQRYEAGAIERALTALAASNSPLLYTKGSGSDEGTRAQLAHLESLKGEELVLAVLEHGFTNHSAMTKLMLECQERKAALQKLQQTGGKDSEPKLAELRKELAAKSAQLLQMAEDCRQSLRTRLAIGKAAERRISSNPAVANLQALAKSMREKGQAEQAAAIEKELSGLINSTIIVGVDGVGGIDGKVLLNEVHMASPGVEMDDLRSEIADLKSTVAGLKQRPGPEEMVSDLEKAKIQYALALKSGFGPQHPKLAGLRAYIAIIEERLANRGQQSPGAGHESAAAQEAAKVQADVQRALADQMAQLAELKKAMAETRQASSSDELRKELARLKDERRWLEGKKGAEMDARLAEIEKALAARTSDLLKQKKELLLETERERARAKDAEMRVRALQGEADALKKQQLDELDAVKKKQDTEKKKLDEEARN